MNRELSIEQLDSTIKWFIKSISKRQEEEQRAKRQKRTTRN